MPSQATLLPLAVAWQLPGAPAFGVRKVMSLPTSGVGRVPLLLALSPIYCLWTSEGGHSD